jgi:hypothetical protein
MPIVALGNTRFGKALFGPILRAYQNSVLKNLAKVGQSRPRARQPEETTRETREQRNDQPL